MSERRFTDGYDELLALDDGDTARLLLLRPEHAPLLARGFERLSPHSRYLRFFAPRTSLTAAELDYLTRVDGENHFAVGAMTPDGARGLGVGRFIRLPDRPEVAEPAITVADEAQGKGLGRALLALLCAAAIERGITSFRFEVLASNEPMRALIEGFAPVASVTPDGDVLHIEVPLPAPSPSAPAEQGPLYRFLALAADGKILVRRAFEWVARAKDSSK